MLGSKFYYFAFILAVVVITTNGADNGKLPFPTDPPTTAKPTTVSPQPTPSTTNASTPITTTKTTTPKTKPTTPAPTHSPTTPTTAPTTPTSAPTTPTSAPTTPTSAPTTPTPHPSTTAKPQPAPADRKFDAFSFLGGFSLALGLGAIGFLSWKFYQSRQESVYSTL